MSAFHRAIAVPDATCVGQARREAGRVAEEAGFDVTESGKVAIVATELANNLARHARAGELLLNAAVVRGRACVDVLAIDRGPGMADVGRCLQDGFSTRGTPGTGLGAVRRLATQFDLYSQPGEGTVIFARLAREGRSGLNGGRFEWGAVCRPAPHELECGDAWRLAEDDGRLVLMVVDGLGHGGKAAEAAQAATAVFERDPFAPPQRILENADAGLRGTRGAALATAAIDTAAQTLKYAGVGNISGVLQHGGPGAPRRGLISHNGIVGQQMRRPQEFEHACAPTSLLLMHSDGLQSRWALERYPGLDSRHPGVIAGVLYRDFRRDRDDITIGVVRLRRQGVG